MANIVVINQWVSYVTKDIANEFAKKHQVALIAGQISVSGRSLNPEIKINRIIKYNRKNKFTRILTWLIGVIQIIILIKLKYKGYHLFLTSNPPLNAFVPLFCNNKYSVQILDVYPDAFTSVKLISENSWIYKIWVKRNKIYFQNAVNIFTITEGMAETISKYCDRRRIKVIHQWPAFDSVQTIPEAENIFIKQHNLEGKFIVTYAGNMGIGHHVTTIVEAANLLKNQNNIAFVIIGEGWVKKSVIELVEKYNLNNCLVLPFQSSEIFAHVLQATDLGVVTVSKEMGNLMIPVKTYNLLINRIPLLAVTEGESELINLVQDYKIGNFFNPSQIKEIADFIYQLYNNNNYLNFFKGRIENCLHLFSYNNSKKYLNGF